MPRLWEERTRDERLATEARVDAHQQDNVHLVHDVLEDVEGRRGVEDEAGLAARRADELERAVDLCFFALMACLDGVLVTMLSGSLRPARGDGVERGYHRAMAWRA